MLRSGRAAAEFVEELALAASDLDVGGSGAAEELRPVERNGNLIEVDVDHVSPGSSERPRWIISIPSSSANWRTCSSR